MTAPEHITAWGYYTSLGINYKAGPRPMENMVEFPATEYTRSDLIPAMIREAVQHEFAELMDAVRSIADDNNRIDMDVFDACEAIIRARKGDNG